eukprot:3935050-Rhodomonas_salina.1
MDTPNHLVRVAFSIPHGDHIIILSRMFNHVAAEYEETYSGGFEQITVSRSSPAVGTKLLLNNAMLADVCFTEISAAITPRTSNYLDDVGNVIMMVARVERIKIIDFVSVVSSEYRIDLVLQIDVHVKFIAHGIDVTAASTNDIVTMFLRVGWCEYIPTTLQGPTRAGEASKCQETWDSHFQCFVLSAEFGNTLFHEWLDNGNLVYSPITQQNLWVPAKRVAGSR